MRRFLRNNGLSLAMFGLFAISLIGQILTGQREFNQDQTEHGEAAVGYGTYLESGHFVEAVFENWESEFLQMAAYVMLTVMLFQKGSSESKDPDSEDPVDADPRDSRNDPNAPWPVRKGGWILTLYEHSLGLSFFLLFLVSIALHARGGTEDYNEEQLVHGGQAISTWDYVGTARFWFESFQNWQSEFLSVGVIVVFSIFLRQRGSPESKPVAAPHSQTGSS